MLLLNWLFPNDFLKPCYLIITEILKFYENFRYLPQRNYFYYFRCLSNCLGHNGQGKKCFSVQLKQPIQ